MPELPARDDLRRLPLRAIVAYAVRCARRVQPLYRRAAEIAEFAKYEADVEAAIALAEREAAKWEAELRAGRYQRDCRMTWEQFRQRYEEEKLAGMSLHSQKGAATAFNHFEAIVKPKYLRSVDSSLVSRFQTELRKKKMPDTSIAAYLRQLRAALNWATAQKFLPEAPVFKMPQQARGQRMMRGRPITGEEFDRLIAAVPDIRPKDAAVWTRFLTGLWLSGLRLEESTVVSWD